MLRTIQTFALDRLAADGRRDGVRRRHAVAFLALLEAPLPPVAEHVAPCRRGSTGWSPTVANLRAADRWAIDAGEVDLALRLVARPVAVLARCSGSIDRGPDPDRDGPGHARRPGRRRPRGPGPRRRPAASPTGRPTRPRPRPGTRSRSASLRALGRRALPADGLFNLGHVALHRVDGRAGPARLPRGRPRALSRAGRRTGRGPRRLGAQRAGPERRTAGGGAERLLLESLDGSTRLDDPQYYAMASASARLGGLHRRATWRARSATRSRDCMRVHAMRDLGDDDDLAAHRRAHRAC